MKKRMVSLLLALVLVLGMLPTVAFAADGYDCTITINKDGPTVDEGITITEITTPEGFKINCQTSSSEYTETEVKHTYFLSLEDNNDGTAFQFTNKTGASITAYYNHTLDGKKCLIMRNSAFTYKSDAATSDRLAVTKEALQTAGYQTEQFVTNTNAATKYFYIFFREDKVNENYAVLVELKPSTTQMDSTKLVEAAKLADTISSETYYTEDDRYNGKTTINDLVAELKANETIKLDSATLAVVNNKAGYANFWALYEAALERANAIYPKGEDGTRTLAAGLRQKQVSAVGELLAAAAENVIPKTQVNATRLYEKLDNYEKNGSYENETDYSAASWPAFSKARTAAEQMLRTLFDANGATAENDTSKHPQSEIDTLLANLNAAENALDTRVFSEQRTGSDAALAGISLYTERYNPSKLTESDYTAESWAAFTSAWTNAMNVLKDHGRFTPTMGIKAELEVQLDAFSALRAACHGLVEKNKDKITVSFAIVDTFPQRQATHTKDMPTFLGTKELEPGTLLKDALTSDYTTNFEWKYKEDSFELELVYINGELIHDTSTNGLTNGFCSWNPRDLGGIALRDGDEVLLVRTRVQKEPNISQVMTPIGAAKVLDKIRYQRITTDQKDNKVSVGVPFTIKVEATSALTTTYDGVFAPVSGAAVFVSNGFADESAARTASPSINTQTKTNAGGTAQITVYEEGWQLINAYILTDDGAYTSGAPILVYAEIDDTKTDLASIKKQLKDELKNTVYDSAYPETFFTADAWTQVQEAYTNGLAAIDAAETSTAARSAELSAVAAVQALQQAAAEKNEEDDKYFHIALSFLPEDLSKVDKTMQGAVNNVINRYEGMTEYQRSQLTHQEVARYEAIKKLNEAGLPDAFSYSLEVRYDFSDIPEADLAGLQAMITWLQDHATKDGWNGDRLGGTQMAKLFSFNDLKSSMTGANLTQITEAGAKNSVQFCFNPGYAAYMHIRADRTKNKDGKAITDANVKEFYPYLVEGNDYAITDTGAAWMIEDMTAQGKTSNSKDGLRYTVNGHEYVLKSVTYTGIDEDAVTERTIDVFDMSNYMGRNENGNTNYKAVTILRSFLSFQMPVNDVTFTVKWSPAGGTEDELTAEKANSRAALKTALDHYGESHENYAAIEEKYNAGLAAIDAASTVDAAAAARKQALKNMANAANGITLGGEIKGWEADSEKGQRFYPGNQIGTVTVTIENRTNDGSASEIAQQADSLRHFYTTDEAYEQYGKKSLWLCMENYPIGENDTMMTVVLRALTDRGCTWTGTGGNGEDVDFAISYLSSITEGDYTLAEFIGGPESGWMGTLNDWFTNEGFSSFTVKNGGIADGDVISIKYTSSGLGADVGGTWGNSNTTLASLKLSGSGNPRLTTSFEPGKEGGTYTYTLVIDGESAELTLDPTAANKNFLVKTFLNEKVTTNAEGASFYKRTESIPVSAGDTIYVGCGLKAWPSMNNQSGNKQTNDGTWYVLQVVSASGSGKAVEEQISALPAGGSLSYSNFEAYAKQIEQAEAAYNSLPADQQAQVSAAAAENLNVLAQKVRKYQSLQAFKAELAALPSPAGVTLADSEAILAAQREYETICKDADLYENLTVAESEKMEQLIAKTGELLVNDAKEKIEAIGEVTRESGEAINAAKAALGRLTEEQRKNFPQELLETLAEAERAYRKLTSGSSTTTKIDSPNKKKDEVQKADASKFRDVSKLDWYFDAVQYALENGLMNGTSEWTFSPNDATTRGMIVTILARGEGVNTNGTPWYAAGQKWAMQNGISDGTNMPGVITREQLATILFRFAKSKGYDTSKKAALTGFPDADKVSTYALDAMQWAVAEGLLQGVSGKLDPQGSATRAQAATILMRFLQKTAK